VEAPPATIRKHIAEPGDQAKQAKEPRLENSLYEDPEVGGKALQERHELHGFFCLGHGGLKSPLREFRIQYPRESEANIRICDSDIKMTRTLQKMDIWRERRSRASGKTI
jgi:hypothetical protein